MRPYALTLFIFIVATAAIPYDAAADEDSSIVINPRTGAASIRNDRSAAVNVDGYLLTSGQAVFNPSGWSTLAANSNFPGWTLGPAEANRLGEANLFSSINVNGGASVGIGSPYTPFTPTAIGQPEPSLTFEYSVPGVGSVAGDVVFAPQNNVVLLVDPLTGSASLQNQSTFNVSIDALLITSPTNALDPAGWDGFAASGIAGWTSGVAEINRLAEGNLFGSTFLSAGGAPIPIGFPINPAAVRDETDLVFEYHISGGGSVTGGVVFSGAASAGLPGDFNGNNAVENADLTLLLNNWGSAVPPVPAGWIGTPQPTAPAIDNDELTALLNNWGIVAGSGSGSSPLSALAVPEPAAGLLLMLGGSLAVPYIVRRSKPISRYKESIGDHR